jgi:hypothetical protein
MNRTQRNRYLPTLESLENRCLMSAVSASLANRVLTINRSSPADAVQIHELNQRISVEGMNIQVGSKSFASVNASQVNLIRVGDAAFQDGTFADALPGELSASLAITCLLLTAVSTRT